MHNNWKIKMSSKNGQLDVRMVSNQNDYYGKSGDNFTAFVINDDGMGLERSNLIQSILSTLKHKDEDYQNRWNKIWEDKISQKYKRTEHQDHWLWNHDFFNADINDLKHILNLIRRKE